MLQSQNKILGNPTNYWLASHGPTLHPGSLDSRQSVMFTFWAASRGPTFTRVVGIPDYQKLILEIVVLPAQS